MSTWNLPKGQIRIDQEKNLFTNTTENVKGSKLSSMRSEKTIFAINGTNSSVYRPEMGKSYLNLWHIEIRNIFFVKGAKKYSKMFFIPEIAS